MNRERKINNDKYLIIKLYDENNEINSPDNNLQLNNNDNIKGEYENNHENNSKSYEENHINQNSSRFFFCFSFLNIKIIEKKKTINFYFKRFIRKFEQKN